MALKAIKYCDCVKVAPRNGSSDGHDSTRIMSEVTGFHNVTDRPNVIASNEPIVSNAQRSTISIALVCKHKRYGLWWFVSYFVSKFL